MLSRDRLIEIASKPILRAVTPIHSRVRVAVLPARIIRAPKASSTSIASLDTGVVRASFSKVEGIRTLALLPMRGLWRGKNTRMASRPVVRRRPGRFFASALGGMTTARLFAASLLAYCIN